VFAHGRSREISLSELTSSSPGTSEPDPPPPARSAGHALRELARELRRGATLLTLAVCLCLGVPAAIVLTPDQDLVSLGQPLSVGARTPSLSISGPAQLVQIGNTALDIPRLWVYGPLRPKLSMGPVQRNAEAALALRPDTAKQAGSDATGALLRGFLRWYGWASLCLLGVTLATCSVSGYGQTLLLLRRHGRARGLSARGLSGSTEETWRRGLGSLARRTLLAVVIVAVAWAGCGALAYLGAMRGLRSVSSLSELVGTYHVSPAPVGPKRFGFAGAVIGDSRASRLGGPPVSGGTPDDRACARSSDSLAAELGQLTGQPVLNLACSGATVAAGVRGPQQRGPDLVPPQLGLLKQAQGLRFVVVVVGPNDIGWTDFLGYCYGSPNCSDNLSQGEFDYRLAAFDRDYGDLLQDLAELPGHPAVAIVTSYRVLNADAQCPDAKGPPAAVGLDQSKIELLNQRNDRLNALLAGGAQKYGFQVADPELTALCDHSADGLGPDLQGLTDPDPFHPTGIGSLRMAAAVLPLIGPSR
jgi:lysophospholipase L1-like esterase